MGAIIRDSARLPTVIEPPSQSPATVYLARLASGSRRTQAQALRVVASIAHSESDPGTFPWHRLDYQHTQAIRAQLAERYAPATANKMLAALRGVLKESWRLGQMDAEQYHRAADVQTVRGHTLPKGRSLATAELAALMRACEATPGPTGDRDAALLAVLYAAGLRRSEIVALDLPDYESRDASIRILHGKGNKGRLCYLNDGAQRRLDSYIGVRGSEFGPLFLRIRKGGHITDNRLTDQGVRDILRRRCEQAGITACSPHDLRRSFISDLLDDGVDISTVQQLAGHANVTTTQRYDRRGEATKRRAAQRLRIP